MATINGTIGNDPLNGGAADDIINGLEGNDTINGYGGNDTMRGGTGDDSYVVDSTSDRLEESAGEGTDSVRSTVSHILGANIENLTLEGGYTAAINGTGNAQNNVITGNLGDNVLNGGAGNDTLVGGMGNDTFIVDAVGDVIQGEAAYGLGTDTVRSSVTWTLGFGLENLVLLGTARVDGTGNDFDNRLAGNQNDNRLSGLFGLDTLFGLGGNDTLSGGDSKDSLYGGTGNDSLDGGAEQDELHGDAGDDRLDGGVGKDTLRGGTGNDTYFTDDAGDWLVEAADSGIDTVRTLATRSLEDNVENMILEGSNGINAIGNTLDNRLTGNSGDNILNGRGGNDTMIGGVGNDIIVVDGAGDIAIEAAGGGNDTVRAYLSHVIGANVESLELLGDGDIDGTGNAGANVITGNDGLNILEGLGGNDSMDGAFGSDWILGGYGNDSLVGDSGNEFSPEFDPNAGQGRILTSTARTYLETAGNSLVNNLGSAWNVSGLPAATTFGEVTLTSNDDQSSSAIDITGIFGSGGFNLFGTSYTSLYVNNNGNLTFGSSLSTYTPGVISAGSNPIIAAFWADVDTRGSIATYTPTPGGNSTGTNRVYYDVDINNGVFTATWDDVGYFSSKTDKLNAFQIQLVDRGAGNADIIFRYESINWTTGGASGGTNGLGGTVARAGYSSGNQIDYQELPQSGNQDQVLALESTLPTIGQATNRAGVYIFQVRDGEIITDPENVDQTPDYVGNDTFDGGAGNDTIQGNGSDDVLDGGAGNDRLEGGNDKDTLRGGEGNDILSGGSGDDMLDGGAGNDNLAGGDGNDGLDGGEGDDRLNGGNGNDSLSGGTGTDTVLGASGSDIVDMGAGRGVADGGAGTDTLAADFSTESAAVDFDSALATVFAGTTQVLSQTNFEAFRIVGTGYDDSFAGSAGNDTFFGGAGVDMLYGGGGNNVLDGGDGNDLLAGGVGNDTLRGGNGNDQLSMGSETGQLRGVAEGGAGVDTLSAHFWAESAGVVFTPAAGATTTVGTVLLTQAGFEVFHLYGSEFGDVFTGGAGNDKVFGESGNDMLNGGAGNDWIFADAGDDTLDGGTGNDSLIGGVGDDTYVRDSVQDNVLELAGEGVDTVRSSLAYTMPANVENLELTGSAAINGTGNAGGNVLTGNAAANTLSGLAGSDALTGGGGNDTLVGTRSGASDIDTLTGGTGVDVFVLGTATARLYDSGFPTIPGLFDYALITDFGSGADRLQLKDTPGYFLGASPISGVAGSGLFHDSNANGVLESNSDELIAVVQGPGAAKALANPIYV